MQVIEPQTSAHTLLSVSTRMTQMEIFFPSLLKELQNLKTDNQRLQSEIDILKAEIREIKAKR